MNTRLSLYFIFCFSYFNALPDTATMITDAHK